MVDPKILLLGIGNLLWADEGFGVRVVEELQRRYRFPRNVRVLDGGTQGIYLVDQVRESDVLVVFDAVDYGLPPVTLKRVQDEEVPKFMGAKKMSLHQTGFQEVLALAELMGDYPEHLLLLGVQPVELEDYGGSLRTEVKAQIGPAIDLALDYLAEFGVRAVASTPSEDPNDLAHAALAIEHYETGRPAPDSACRNGDVRFLAWRGED